MASRSILKTIISVSKTLAPGPAPAFTAVHVSRAILYVGDQGPIGRIELSRKLGVGEGAVRTIIRHLTKAKLVDIAKGGCVLTQRGTVLYKSLRAKLSEVRLVNSKQLALDKASAAVLVRGSGKLVNRGIEQRDAAIRVGATGVCTLVYKNGKLVMPEGERENWILQPQNSLFAELLKAFSPDSDDVITIASAPSHELAEHSAMAAALTLLR